MPIRLATEQDHDEVITTFAVCFNQDVEQALKDRKDSPINNHEQFILNVDDKNKVQSMLSVVDFNVYFEKNIVRYGGIAGVSTLPEFRRMGKFRETMKYALTYMKEHNMILSGLAPFKCEFYRKFGYEWVYNWKIISVSLDDLQTLKKASSYRNFSAKSANVLEKFRNKIIQNINGCVVRDDYFVKNQWSKYQNRHYFVVGVYENHKLVSYMVYNTENNTIKVDEIYFKDEISRQYLLAYLYDFKDQYEKVEIVLERDDNLRTVLPNPRINCWWWPNMMGRIVMVKEALELLNIKQKFNKSYNLRVVDKMASWNDKTFNISYSNKHLKVVETKEKIDIEISIQRLTQLVFGFLSAKDAIESNLIIIYNQSASDSFCKSFTKRKVMIWQEF